MQTVSIIVAERGSEWMSWAHALRRSGGESTLVIAQSSVEDDATFAHRVGERLRRLERAGTVVMQAAFVGGERADDRARIDRSAILRRLSSLLSTQGRNAKLYLDAATRQGQRSLQLMRALGMALAEMSRGSGLSVRIGTSALLPQQAFAAA